MKTIESFENEFKNNSNEWIERVLAETLLEIKFLESIYTTGGQNNYYSGEFTDAAYKERQMLCKKSSALYKVKRDRAEQVNS